ncbi:MAG TPA: HTTM domain-containing protein [Kofleriaceae bacterium]
MAKKRSKKGQRPAVKADAPQAASANTPTAEKAPPEKAASRPEKTSKSSSKSSKTEAKNGPAKLVTLPPAPSPAFFFGYDVPWAKLLVFRFIVFGMLGVDALLQISHAPRYFAGGFNVANLPWMDSLGPGRVGFAIGELVASLLFAFIACGVATRVLLPLVTAIYGWLYFGSQLDSYQHHYLVWLVLLLSCFVPWEKPAGTPAAQPVRAWAVRLILIQLGILYFYAAISKCNPAWMDGRALELQLQGPVRSLIDATIHMKAAAKMTVLLEFSLAFAVWTRRAWFYALPAGVLFHVGIIASGLEIGLFAWLMLGFYLLVVPNEVYAATAAALSRATADRDTLLGALAAAIRGIGTSWWMALGGVAGGMALAVLTHFDMALPVACVALAMCIGAVAATREQTLAARVGIGFLVGFAIWFGVDRKTDTAVDYYRFWGGNARRLGDPDTSERAYRRLTQIAPDNGNGHFQLGKMLMQRGQDAEALDELHAAQRLEPGKARAFTAEAEYLSKKGNRADAIKKAEEATYAEPDDASAQALVRRLGGTGAQGNGGGGDDKDDQ